MTLDYEKYGHLYENGEGEDGLIFLPHEIEEGNIEYKRSLVNPSPERLVRLTSQLKWRLFEGQGEAFYQLGVDDDGSPFGLSEMGLEKSINNLRKMAAELNCKVIVVCKRPGNNGFIAEVLVREVKDGEVCSELRVAVIGDSNCGKSTLIGVLTGGQLDNGRGYARVSCFNHQHEVLSGRTSSIGYQLMGFNVDGECLNDKNDLFSGNIIEESYKVISFIDLAGHEKYFSLAVEGITGHMPDYCFLVVSATSGITKITRDHFRIALSMKIPVIVVITKIDACRKNILKYAKTLASVKKLLSSVNKTPIVLDESDDVYDIVKDISANEKYPIVGVSNVDGDNLNLLKSLLNALPQSITWETLKDETSNQTAVLKIYQVEGVGVVLGGIVLSGSIKIDDEVLLGPTDNGRYLALTVKTLQINRVPVSIAEAGRACSITFYEHLSFEDAKKGMFLVSGDAEPIAVWSFDAQIAITHHPTSIKVGYEPVVQCMKIKQVAKISQIRNLSELRTGDKDIVTFEFKYRPEYIREGMRIFFPEGIGFVTSTTPTDSIIKVTPSVPLRSSRDDILRSPSFRVSTYTVVPSSI